MADPAEPQQPQKQDLGPCGWCGERATTEIYIVGKKGAKHRTKAPVCEQHEARFIAQGATSVRSELDDMGPKNVKSYVIR